MLILRRSLINISRFYLQPVNRPKAFCDHRYFSNQSLEKMSKTALVILAPGAEEMEFVISADVLRRAGVSLMHMNVCMYINCKIKSLVNA